MVEFFQTNLSEGAVAGLGLMYSFNLINGGVEYTGCPKLGGAGHNCAMSPAELRQMANAIASLSDDKGCGLMGWEIDGDPGPSRTYLFSGPIQSALEDVQNTVGGLRPGSCGP